MTPSLDTDLAFPETTDEAIRNLAITQGILLDFMEGVVHQLHADDPELIALWQAAKALNASTEVYING